MDATAALPDAVVAMDAEVEVFAICLEIVLYWYKGL
jgi:hypothetical protein